MNWNTIADDKTLTEAADALKKNGFEVIIVENGEAAKAKVLEIIPKGAEVFTATSTTANVIGLTKILDESGAYNSIRSKMLEMDRSKDRNEMVRLGAAPDWIVGSVHAITKDGMVIIASASGSQLPGYAYGASHVLWIVGAQKIVKSLDEGLKRIYEYTLPLESERVRKVYGMPRSTVSKLLIMGPQTPGRITVVLVKEALGF